MRTKNSIFSILLACLLSIPLSGYGQQGRSENERLVDKAFEYLNADNLDGLLSIVSNSNVDYITMKKTLGGHVHVFGYIINALNKCG